MENMELRYWLAVFAEVPLIRHTRASHRVGVFQVCLFGDEVKFGKRRALDQFFLVGKFNDFGKMLIYFLLLIDEMSDA